MKKKTFAYTPGLKVSPYTTITKIRELPLSSDYEIKYDGKVLKGEVLVKKGENVEAGTIVASANLPGHIFPLRVTDALGCEPCELSDFMLKKEGDIVKAGEVIAFRKSFIKWFDAKYEAPFDGTVESIDSTTGQITLAKPPRYIEINAYLKGIVADVVEHKSAAVQTNGAFVQGIFGLSGEACGGLAVLGKKNDSVIDANDLDKELKDKIILAPGFMTLEAILKAQEIGAKGIITASIDSPYIEKLLGKDLGVAITGRENIITIIVTEGFGSYQGYSSKLKMADKTYSILSDLDGYFASINGSTQIRAGVKRPEVIIPLDKPNDYEAENEEPALEIGSVIRATREPYFGILGRVTKLPKKLQVVESGAKVRVLEARLENCGKPVIIPRANVELI